MTKEKVPVEGRIIDDIKIVGSNEVHPSYKDFYKKFYFQLQDIFAKYAKTLPSPFELKEYENFLLSLISKVGNACTIKNGLRNFEFFLQNQNDFEKPKPTV